MKNFLIIAGIFTLIIVGALNTTGILRLIIIFAAFPIIFIYCPSLFMIQKKEELTDEAKIEQGLMKKKSIYDEKNDDSDK